MQLPPLGLYIHLPWCERKCPYCDFNSHEIDTLPEQQYVEALLKDLRRDSHLIADRELQTIFIGGGTPSLFSPSSIERLFTGISEALNIAPNLEATMEANPGSAEADKFKSFAQAGINRLSLGIQSFDDKCLSALGRVHDSAAAHRAVEYAQAAGFDSLNLDLMHGLPGQSQEAASADLAAAIEHAPEHLSWYQLTIEPNTVFYKQPPSLPNEDNLADIQQAGEYAIRAAGFEQYEVSAFSKPGYRCRHNLNYWRFGDYLGIGAGAHAKLRLADGSVQRTAKRRQPDDYLNIAGGQERGYIANSRLLEKDDLVGEFMLNALRLNEGFATELFSAATGLALETLEPALSTLVSQGLLAQENDRISATATGRRFLNDVVARFFPD
jgi:putative oxygen-independent coproporphyrinogen III oxidase